MLYLILQKQPHIHLNSCSLMGRALVQASRVGDVSNRRRPGENEDGGEEAGLHPWPWHWDNVTDSSECHFYHFNDYCMLLYAIEKI